MSAPVWRNERGRRIGESHWRARLSDADVQQVLDLRDAGLSYAAIAAKLDDFEPPIGRSTIADICRGKSRSQVAYRCSR